ncbi:MAG TPA: SRPBCC family protein [Nitrososphaera sp.]|nr:SRPBCC family protein [Nitrososphaera sp.]
MKVRISTEVEIHAPPEKVWQYLCDAHMPTAAPWCFKLGVTTPNECKIVGEANGIGSHRQCRTSKGFIDQQITEWTPPYRLTFIATSDTIGMYKHVRQMQDTFLLEAFSQDDTKLTRLTQFETKGAFDFVKPFLFRFTVRRLHKYVMEGFKTLAEQEQQKDS